MSNKCVSIGAGGTLRVSRAGLVSVLPQYVIACVTQRQAFQQKVHSPHVGTAAFTTTPSQQHHTTHKTARRHAGTQASQQGEPRTNEQRSRGLILIAGCRGLANRGSLFRRAYLAPRCHGVVVWIAVACGTVASPGWHVRWQWAQWSMVQSSIRKRVVLIKGCIASNPTVPEL